MTANIDIANRALQLAGTRTSMSEAEFLAQSSNEAIQARLVIYRLRDELNRMAPWDCVTRFANLTYITSIPTTPENSGAGPPLWQPGMPAPPWAYEYQYPVDCLRARFIMPQYTSLAGGTPIYPMNTATGVAQVGWTGPALKFKVSTDNFYSATAATVGAAGTGYAVGDVISLVQPTFTFTQNYPPLTGQVGPQTITMSVGAPALVQVLTVDGGGGILTAALINQVYGSDDSVSGGTTQILSGSYFGPVVGAQAANFTVGGNGQVSAGVGATFNLTLIASPIKQRVILCNQEQAILCYNAVITDPNVMDPLFQDAWEHILGARLCFQLTGDKGKANELIGETNNIIIEARKADGNEGITVNDVTPDFLRIRGNYGGPAFEYSPNMSFDWGNGYSPY